ncbi:N-acetyltransferase [Corynebacterium diphtheriae]|nr:N-acetyltransferase [Corynebacterium diphtheriae]
MSDIQVRHEEADKQFVIAVDGEDAGFAGYSERDGHRNFNHTVIDPRFRGQGLSQPLIQQALEATHADGFGAIATCSAVVGFVQKNPEFRDYLA